MELIRPSFGLIFWMLIGFALLFFVLAKFAWPFITKSIAARNKKIQDQLDEAARVHAELERLCTPELYEQHQEEHYIRNVIVDRPAVISVNGHLAYLAVLELLERMIGYCSEQTHGQLVVLLHEGGTIPSPESRFMVDDYLAKYKGRGDLQPYLNMPLLSTF